MTSEFYEKVYFTKNIQKEHEFTFTQGDTQSRGLEIEVLEGKRKVGLASYELAGYFLDVKQVPYEIEAEKKEDVFYLEFPKGLFDHAGTVEGELILKNVTGFHLAMNPMKINLKESIRFKGENQEVKLDWTVEDVRKVKVNEAKNADRVNGFKLEQDVLANAVLTDTKYDDEINELERKKLNRAALIPIQEDLGKKLDKKDFVDTVYDDTPLRNELAKKVNKVAGKGLSTNDYTNEDKAEVAKVKDKADKGYVDSEIADLDTRKAEQSDLVALDERLEENEEDLEQHKVDYVEDIKRVRATEPLGKLLAYDTFNRPDGSLGVSDSGHEWVSYGRPALISNGFHKGGSANNTLYDLSAIALGDEVRSSVLKVDVVSYDTVRGAGLFLGVDQNNGVNLYSSASVLYLTKIVEGVRTGLYQSKTYAPWGDTDSDWYVKARVLQSLELTTVYIDSAVLFNAKIILNGVEFSEEIKITDPETLSIISNANKVGITQTSSQWYAKNFVVRGLGV